MSPQELDELLFKHIETCNLNANQYIQQKIHNINKYLVVYYHLEDYWYREYVLFRLDAKKYEDVNPNLSLDDLQFLKTQENFIDYFIYFLKLKIKTDFYVQLENKIVDSTRINQDDNSLGEPTLDKTIRNENSLFIKNLGNEVDGSYKIIEQYLNYIEDTHSTIPFQDFIELIT